MPSEFAIHSYGTGEKLPIRMAVFQPSGNLTERYRIASGLYSTCDSTTYILSIEQFRQFLQIQAIGELSPELLQILNPQGVVGTPQELTPKQKLLRRILVRRDSIERE